MKIMVLGLVLMLGGIAAADSKSDDCAVQRKNNPNAVCTLNIDGDDVNGSRQNPLGEDFGALRPVEHGNLIYVRQNFIPEMVRSLYNLI